MWSRSSFVFESRWILFFFPTSLRNWWMVEDFSKPTIFYSQLLPFSRLICLNFLTLPHQFTYHLSLSFSISLYLSLFYSFFFLSLSLSVYHPLSPNQKPEWRIFLCLSHPVSLLLFGSFCLNVSITQFLSASAPFSFLTSPNSNSLCCLFLSLFLHRLANSQFTPWSLIKFRCIQLWVELS